MPKLMRNVRSRYLVVSDVIMIPNPRLISTITINQTGASNIYQLGVTDFSNELKEDEESTIFENQYYPSLMNENPVKNTCKLEKNII